MTTVHVPILVQPIIDALIEPLRKLEASAPAGWLVDGTFGGGGHTGAILAALAADPHLARHRVLAVDQDAGAVERGHARYAAEIAAGRLLVEHRHFGELDERLRELSGQPAPNGQGLVWGLTADLGFSSDQIENPARGLSFQSDGPLDMRMDPDRGESARSLLQRLRESEIADLIFEFGEERFSRRIAGAIVRARSEGRMPSTTHELSDLIVKSLPPPARYGRLHAATRTFQALRIAVNQELDELDSLLDRVIPWITQGGRVAILSFHSLEDRRVKVAFRERPEFSALTKKPLEAGEDEVRRNARARSARLRIAERITYEQK